MKAGAGAIARETGRARAGAASARVETRPAAATAVVGAGVAILLLRPFVAAGPVPRVWLFAATYVAICAAALAVPSHEPSAPPRLSRTTALALGVGGVVAAALASGAAVPAPRGTAAIPVALLAAVAEEALFRRAAYDRLVRFGVTVAVVGTAALFAAVHLPAYGVTALPVDLGAGLLLSWQRWASGSWAVPAATHAAANLLTVLR